MTSIGNGEVMSATRSASPRSTTASTYPATMRRTSSSISAMRRTVKTRDTNWRNTVWSGGSISIICSKAGRSRLRSRRLSRATPPVDEKVPKSRNASSTSSKRLNAQNRRSGFQ